MKISWEDKKYCPLVRREITELICEDVSAVAEEMQPARFAPSEFREVVDWREICMGCSEHPE